MFETKSNDGLFCRPLSLGIINQFVRFSTVGVVGTLAQYICLLLLINIFGINVVLASTLGFILGGLINYSLNRKYTFRSDKRHREAMSKFFAIAFVGLLLNSLVMAIGVLYLHYIVAQVIATGLVLFWTFTGNRLWTFREY